MGTGMCTTAFRTLGSCDGPVLTEASSVFLVVAMGDALITDIESTANPLLSIIDLVWPAGN
jgi:hypothetical protein